MKITSLDVIKNSERDLMDAITADLDWGAVEKIFRERHNLGLEEDIEYKKGDIVVHGDQVAYRLDFVAKVTLSVLLDRNGDYLSINISGEPNAVKSDHDIAPVEEGRQVSNKDGYEQVLSQFGQEEKEQQPQS